MNTEPTFDRYDLASGHNAIECQRLAEEHKERGQMHETYDRFELAAVEYADAAEWYRAARDRSATHGMQTYRDVEANIHQKAADAMSAKVKRSYPR